jgi:hypothetical protein
MVVEGQVSEKWRTPANLGGVGQSSEHIDSYKCVLDKKFLFNIASKLSGFKMKILRYYA